MTQKGVDEAGGAPSTMQGLVPTDEGAVLEYHGARRPDAFSEGAGVRAARAIAQYLDAERQSANRRKDRRVPLELAHG